MPLWVLLLVLVTGGVVAVLVASGRGDGIHPPVGPAAHELAPGPAAALADAAGDDGRLDDHALDGVRAARFALALRGYRPDEVDATLDALLSELDARGRVIAELEARLRAAPAPPQLAPPLPATSEEGDRAWPPSP